MAGFRADEHPGCVFRPIATSSWSSSDATWQLVLAGLAGAAILYTILRKAASRKPRLPPGPRGWPVLGSLVPIFANPHKLPHQVLFDLCRQYGPVVSFRMGSRLAVVIDSPDMAREFLKERDAIFSSRPVFGASKYLLFQENTVALSPYNKHTKRLLSILSTEILSPRRVQQSQVVRQEEVAGMVTSILDEVGGTEAGKQACINIHDKVALFLFNVSTLTIFSKRFFAYGGKSERESDQSFVSNPEQAVEFKVLVKEVLRLALSPLFEDFVPSLGFLDGLISTKRDMQATHARLDAFYEMVIAEHRQYLRTIEPGATAARDVLDVLLSLPGGNGAGTMANNEMKGILNTMYDAGTDTAMLSIEWAMAELLKHPEQLKTAQQEMDAVVGRDRVVTEADVPNLPYLQAVVKETFRLHPPVPLLIPHCASEACQVAGFDIPANTMLYVNAWGMARNPDVWDQPLDFNPGRFMNSQVDFKGAHYQLLPFGAGRRRCPGVTLGALTVHYTVGRLVQAFNWNLPEGVTPENLDMSESSGTTVRKKQPLVAVPSPRLPAQLY